MTSPLLKSTSHSPTSRIALITGGSRGIGKAICEEFCQQGIIVLTPSKDELDCANHASIKRYLSSLAPSNATSSNTSNSPSTTSITPNLSHTSAQNITLKDIDIFIHCAGINPLSTIEQSHIKHIEKMFFIHVFSAMEICAALAPYMKLKQKGAIVLISSIFAHISKYERVIYSSAKASVEGLMRGLSVELASFGVLVNTIAPGFIHTDMTRLNNTQEALDSISKAIPLGRLGEASEVARLAYFLSVANSYITGQVITIDGGFSCV